MTPPYQTVLFNDETHTYDAVSCQSEIYNISNDTIDNTNYYYPWDPPHYEGNPKFSNPFENFEETSNHTDKKNALTLSLRLIESYDIKYF